MRPGRLHPGNRPADEAHGAPKHHASMRPGRLHPGNAARRARRRRQRPSFNEAGASPPGNAWLAVLSRRSGGASMRPGRLHPGNPIGPQWTQGDDLASMRPGRLHPGNSVTFYTPLSTPPASMRPGRLHPGNRPHGDRGKHQHGGFNEAGASPPRKCWN